MSDSADVPVEPLDIALDMDDTMGNFTAAWVVARNHLHPQKPPLVHLDVNRYDLCAVGDLSVQELQDTFTFVRAHNYALNMTPTDKLFGYWINKMIKAGHRLYVLTANPEYVAPKISHWMACYGVTGLNVVCVEKSADKMNHKWDVLVDDNPQLAKLATKAGRHFIMYAAQHNRHMNRTVPRLAMNWESVYRHITEIATTECHVQENL